MVQWYYFRLFIKSADVYSPYIAACIVCNMLAISCAIFKLELVFKSLWITNCVFPWQKLKVALIFFRNDLKELGSLDSDTLMLFTAMLSGISNLFIYCFFGKLATESFIQMANSLFESDWLNLPIELQKYYVIIIGNAQQSLFYHGFKMVALDLETFTKVWIFIFMKRFFLFLEFKKQWILLLDDENRFDLLHVVQSDRTQLMYWRYL